jgi:hypothetical protein
MTRRTNAFYKALHVLREGVGDKEFLRDSLVPGVIKLLEADDIKGSDLLISEANKQLDSAERADAKDTQGMFDLGGHVPLGEGLRIRRGCMKLDHLIRRNGMLNKVKRDHDLAWAAESLWLDDTMTQLGRMGPDATVNDITANAAAAA